MAAGEPAEEGVDTAGEAISGPGVQNIGGIGGEKGEKHVMDVEMRLSRPINWYRGVINDCSQCM